MLIGVMMPTVQMGNAWFTGQIPAILPYSITQKMPPASTLAVGIQVSIQILHSLVSIPTVVYQTNLRKVSKVSISTLAYYSTQVCTCYTKQDCKAMELRKAKWSHYITLTNKLAWTLPPLDSLDMDQAYQCFCDVISTAAKKCIRRDRRNNRISCWDAECENLNKHSCSTLKGMNLAELQELCLPGLTGNRGVDGLRLSRKSTFQTLAGQHEIR